MQESMEKFVKKRISEFILVRNMAAFEGPMERTSKSYEDILRERVRRLEGVFGLYRPWPLNDVLNKLIEAAEHLTKDHSCDAHGYEEIIHALGEAKYYLSEIKTYLSENIKK